RLLTEQGCPRLDIDRVLAERERVSEVVYVVDPRMQEELDILREQVKDREQVIREMKSNKGWDISVDRIGGSDGIGDGSGIDGAHGGGSGSSNSGSNITSVDGRSAGDGGVDGEKYGEWTALDGCNSRDITSFAIDDDTTIKNVSAVDTSPTACEDHVGEVNVVVSDHAHLGGESPVESALESTFHPEHNFHKRIARSAQVDSSTSGTGSPDTSKHRISKGGSITKCERMCGNPGPEEEQGETVLASVTKGLEKFEVRESTGC
ncbi:unnamed protein product, partial [Choristocarpus tenellus]